jgi:site-specific recombinase XerD
MAIEAKVEFMQTLEKHLADKLTVTDMGTLLAAVSDILEGYEMRSVQAWDNRADDLLDCYLSALSVENRSQKTIDRYAYVIRRMMEFVKVPTRQISIYHLRAYLAHEKERGIQDSTLEGTREIFTAYFNWLQRENLIDRNPTANLGVVKRAKKEKKTYSGVDLERLNLECRTVRDRAIISFLSSTGCRISEMTGLDRAAVDLEKLECVVHGKGAKDRTVYLSDVAGMLISQYLAERTDDNPALFVGCRNERLQPGGVRIMLKAVAKRAGVDHVHPHKFRRTLATELSRNGMPIQEVANILGHEKIDTTMKYVILNKDDVKSSYRRYA